MSTLVNNNNDIVFGENSYLNKTITNKNLKQYLVNLITENSSEIFRKKAFDSYMLCESIFKNNSDEWIDLNIKYAIGKLLSPFITRNIQSVKDLTNGINKSKYSQGEIDITNEISKKTGVKNTAVMILDTEKESLTSCKGITTYITPKASKGMSNELNVSWVNGFFEFSNAADFSILITIPKTYIASLIIHTISENKEAKIGATDLDNLAFKGLIVDSFAKDLTKSFIAAIYNDKSKARILKDILIFTKMLNMEGATVTAIYNDSLNINIASDCFAKYEDELKELVSSNNNDKILSRTFKYAWSIDKSTLIINPIEFYNSIIDAPYCQIVDTLTKCKCCPKTFEFVEYDMNNSLKSMKTFFKDSERDIYLYGIKLVKYLPILLYTTYIVNGGANHIETKNIIEQAKSFVINVLGWKASNPQFAYLGDFIAEEINYFSDELFTQLASPLTNTSEAREALIHAINRLDIDSTNFSEMTDDERMEQDE